MNILHRIGTVFIVLVLTGSAIDKVAHWGAFQAALGNYTFLGSTYRNTIAFAVVIVEFLLSAALIGKRWRQYALLACVGLFSIFAVALYILYQFHPGVACGCVFSFGLTKVDTHHVVQNVLLAALCFLLWHTLPGRKVKQVDQTNRNALTGHLVNPS